MRHVISVVVIMIMVGGLYGQDMAAPINTIGHAGTEFYVFNTNTGKLETVVYGEHAQTLDAYAAVEMLNTALEKRGYKFRFSRRGMVKIEASPKQDVPTKMILKGSDGNYYMIEIKQVPVIPMSNRGRRMVQ